MKTSLRPLIAIGPSGWVMS